MARTSAKLAFGGNTLGPQYGIDSEEKAKEVLEILTVGGISSIEMSPGYVQGEELIGSAGAASQFQLNPKFLTLSLGQDLSIKDELFRACEESLNRYKAESFDIYYLHAPDSKHSLKDILSAFNELHKAGKFKRFGLSNHRDDEVEEVIRVAKEHNYVLPSVVSSHYSAVARSHEKSLLPVLRKHNIAFYAYSPSSGGFLAKTREDLSGNAQGRWDPSTPLGQCFRDILEKPTLLNFLDKWDQLSTRFGIPKAEMAYRWIVYNSELDGDLGDNVIIGATNPAQLQDTLDGLKKGPLDAELVKEIDVLWSTVDEKEAPLDHFHDFMIKFFQ